MTQLMRFTSAVARDPSVDAWFARVDALRTLAQPWFELMRNGGGDVRELLHEGCPTACVEDAAFGYVNVFSRHVNIGFFQGAMLPDPSALLEGSGKCMRHVKLHWGVPVDEAALTALITAAYCDMQARVAAGE